MAETQIYPKKNKSDIVYYVKKLGYRFSIPIFDKDGNRIQAKNNATGLPLFNHRGEPEYLSESVAFTPWKTRFCEEGYVAIFVVTKETPKVIADTLKADAASRSCEIMDEKTYIKTINPDLFARMQEDTERDALIDRQGRELADAKEEIARLREKLQGRRQ